MRTIERPAASAGGFFGNAARGRETVAVTQLTPCSGQVRHTSVHLGDVSIVSMDHPCGTQFRKKRQTGRLLVGFVRTQTAQITVCGDVWHRGEVAFVRDAPVDVCSLGDAAYRWIDVPAEPLAEMLTGCDVRGGACALRGVDAEALGDLAAVAERATRPGSNASEFDVAAVVSGALQASSRTRYRCAEATAARVRFDLVLCAEAYMWQHIGETLTLESIAGAVGCSVRLLTHSYHRAYGIGPLTHFRLQRLNAVRRRLLESPATSVTKAAIDHGFWHSGHFSTQYRALFGRTAAQTHWEACARYARA
ncbi:MAG TPA: helix-turn-helix transcriptional regulator [Candidatus Acidoferrales bacterium]|nr:helix-turn-helix transcriptional regulator [Candidatus Acidoferrales bacterium]